MNIFWVLSGSGPSASWRLSASLSLVLVSLNSRQKHMICLTEGISPQVRQGSGSVLVIRCLWINHVCPILILLRITSWRLGRWMVGHGRMLGLISFSLVRRVDQVCCQFLRIYSEMKYLESCNVYEQRTRECGDEMDCLAHISANSYYVFYTFIHIIKYILAI